MVVHVFIGVVGSGKDYAAQQVFDEKARQVAKTIAFADALRAAIWHVIGWTPKNDEEYQKFKHTDFTDGSDLGIQFTGRDLMQKIGTDLMRKENPHVWTEKVEEKLMEHIDFDAVTVTDCRFVNEITALKRFMTRCRSLHPDKPVRLQFTFCDYKSKRYNSTSDHESEKLAQAFLKQGYKHGDDLTPVIMTNNYLKFCK